MKFGIVRSMLLVGVLAALVSCKKPEAEVAAEPESEPIAVTTSNPGGAVGQTTPIALATPAPDPLAPPGIYFLIQKASITTEDGIVGLKPGQGLRMVGPGTYEVNGHTVQLRDHQVTNNLRIARQHAAADAAAQASLRQAMQIATAPKPAPSSPKVSATPTPQPISRPVAVPVTSLSSGSRLGAGTGAADPETSNRRNVKVDSSGRQYWRDSRGNTRYDF